MVKDGFALWVNVDVLRKLFAIYVQWVQFLAHKDIKSYMCFLTHFGSVDNAPQTVHAF